MIKRIYLILFLLLIVSEIFSQKIILDTNQIVIGDTVRIRIQIDINKGRDIIFPVFEDYFIVPELEISSQKIDTINDGKTLEMSLLLQAFPDSSIIVDIPPVGILVNSDTLYTNSLRLSLLDFIPDSAFISKIDTSQILKIADIKKPIEAPLTFKEFWELYGKIIVAILFFVLLIGGIIWFIIRNKQEKPIFATQKPKIPAHIIAIEKLDELTEKRLPEKEKLKEYYTELTVILRNYIEKTYSIPAMEYTSEQIIYALSYLNKDNPESVKTLKPILSIADLVKFAKTKPLQNENDLNIGNAYLYIEQTKPEEKKTENDIDIDKFIYEDENNQS